MSVARSPAAVPAAPRPAPSSIARPAASPAGWAAPRLTLPLYAATLFVSALLLFGVQPMFTKMILPVLGGSPAVWSVAMVFFQAALLAGYLYAHLLVRYLPLRLSAGLHLTLMAGALAAMPIAVAGGWGRPPAGLEAPWLVGLFAASVGLPFFAVAANGPLLQAWFARSGHPAAADPYFLYGASNLGSFAALLLYPVLVELLLPLGAQSLCWRAGFVGLAALVALCAVAAGRGTIAAAAGSAAGPTIDPAARGAAEPDYVSWRWRLAWIGLAAVPSGLLVSVTAHISTDVAAAPLLWVLPLALYLLAFVLAFRERALVPDRVLAGVQAWGTALALGGLVLHWPLGIGLPLHLGLFLANALIGHRALYRLRPGPARLTEFYLHLSLGGVIGGVACSLVAPAVFSTVLEYPLLLVAAVACRPGLAEALRAGRRAGLARLAGPLAILAVASAVVGLAGPEVWMVATAASAVTFLLLWRHPGAALAAAGALALLVLNLPQDGSNRAAYRSFFGVHKVVDVVDGRFRVLMHGTTMHGATRMREEDGSPATGRPDLLTYYTSEGPFGRALEALRAGRGGRLASVAVAGLGAGVIACHARPGEDWRFFEIDPVVVQLARDSGLFRSLATCAPGAPIRLGDARLTLAEEPGLASVVILDAFSSDAIPAHLLTREAIGLYLSKLDAHGAILVHITNRHLELRHILARAAAEHGLVTYVRDEAEDRLFDEPFEQRLRARVKLAVLARDPADLGALATDPRWRRVEPDPRRRPWTDDFSNILEALRDHWAAGAAAGAAGG